MIRVHARIFCVWIPPADIMAKSRQHRSVLVQRRCATFAVGIRYLLPRSNSKGDAMKKIVLAIATAATLAVTAIAAPAPAEARGGRVAAGVLGGLAAGAIIGGAASGAYAYGPRYGYYGGPAYVAGPPCGWERQRFWDGYGWRIRQVRVCY
jgi:hypothetical protein